MPLGDKDLSHQQQEGGAQIHSRQLDVLSGQRHRVGRVPTPGYTADCAGPEAHCSPRSFPQEE